MTIEPGRIYRPHPSIVPHPSAIRVRVLAIGREPGDGDAPTVAVRYVYVGCGVLTERFTAPLATFLERWAPDDQ